MAGEQKIGRYIVRELLGKGNMGCVYRAFDPTLKRWVAIKTIRSHLKSSAKDSLPFKDRFFREAQTNSQLNHPNIVGIYDSGMFQNNPFLVMEYIEGASLNDLIIDDVIDDLLVKFRLLRQIAAGLDYAHRRGVVHRDIKPANILVSLEVEAKIVDFGLAKLKDNTITTTGVFLGTPSYASPEQIVTGDVDKRSDIFSLGIMTYEMLTGIRPFPGENINTILYHIVHSDPDLAFEQKIFESQREKLREIFGKVLAKGPDDRHQAAGDFLRDVEKAMGIDKLPDLSESLPTTSMIQLAKKRGSGEMGAGRSHPLAFEETMLLTSGSSMPLSERRALIFGGGGGLLLALLLVLVFWVRSNGPDPDIPQAETGPVPAANTETGPQPTSAIDVYQLMETELNQELQKVHDELHESFLSQIADKQLKDADATLGDLKKMGFNVANEEQILDILKSQIQNNQNARRAEVTKQRIQQDFKKAQNQQDLEAMERSLREYRSLWPGETVVLDAWNLVVSERRALRDQEVRQIRQVFDYATRMRDIVEANAQLSLLRELRSATEEDEAQVKRIEETTFVNSLGMKFIRLPGGSFIMGEQGQDPGQNGSHYEVVLSKEFYMGMFEVTQQQWTSLMGNNPSTVQAPNLPVTNVSWKDALAFARRLNEHENDNRYRLPSEAEWEYACRAGTTTPFSVGAALAVEDANFKEAGHPRPILVGSYPPNPWGFFDMHGNVSEWVYDIYASLPKEKRVDPILYKGPSRSYRVVRGGSYDSPASRCESGYRVRRARRHTSNELGFRLVRVVEGPAIGDEGD